MGYIRDWDSSMSYDENRLTALTLVPPYNPQEDPEYLRFIQEYGEDYSDLWNPNDEYRTNRGRAKARWVKERNK